MNLQIAASPHLKHADSTERIMWSVVIALLPVIGGAVWFFGIGALLVVLTTTIAAVLTERAFGPGGTLRDGSAAITGLLLGLTLPPGFPMWMAFIGGAIAIGVGKLVFGGLGQNVFNPALIGRAFLQAAFPTAITTWPVVSQGWTSTYASNFAIPFAQANTADVITAATPLGLMKFEQTATNAASLFMGSVGGSIGETSALLILIGGAYLAYKRYLDWRIPVSILATVAVFATLLHTIDAQKFADAPFMLFSGGLMLGAVYMATDMVTSPITHKGAWIFGIGIGLLVVLIRVWGGLPEGVMYAILLMNAVTPAINRLTQPRVFGAVREKKVAAV